MRCLGFLMVWTHRSKGRRCVGPLMVRHVYLSFASPPGNTCKVTFTGVLPVEESLHVNIKGVYIVLWARNTTQSPPLIKLLKYAWNLASHMLINNYLRDLADGTPRPCVGSAYSKEDQTSCTQPPAETPPTALSDAAGWYLMCRYPSALVGEERWHGRPAQSSCHWLPCTTGTVIGRTAGGSSPEIIGLWITTCHTSMMCKTVIASTFHFHAT